jgi:hypothetical protein
VGLRACDFPLIARVDAGDRTAGDCGPLSGAQPRNGEVLIQIPYCYTEGRAMATKTVDLVVQGGGVKGIAALGAILPLYDTGYRFHRAVPEQVSIALGEVTADLRA